MPKRATKRKEEKNGGSRPEVGDRLQGHDIIVIGASAGGVEALKDLVRRLPSDLPAAVFIVLHTAPYPPSALPEILNSAGRLPASHAIHGEGILPGHIYVAPSDNHLTLQKGKLSVVRGPKENGHRPAVDPLFRTAARAYGARVIGVILTGALDCGTGGLMTIKSLGGVTVVQDPKEAFCPDMPQSAIDHVKVDYILPISGMAPLLERVSREQVKESGATMSKKNKNEIEQKTGEGETLSKITCPECNGSLTESELGGLLLFRCHVGHAYSTDGMIAEQAATLESALWSAVRALEESEMLARRVAARSDPEMAARFDEKAYALRQHADVIQKILLSGDTMTRTDASTFQRRTGRDRSTRMMKPSIDK
jgi:two-component system chemotaxis response regulator CheB